MKINKINTLAGVAALLFATGATAATVSVNPNAISVSEGQSFSANIVGDFTDVGGTVQGGFSLVWDASLITLNAAASGVSTDLSNVANFNEFFSIVDVAAGRIDYSYSTCPVFGVLPCDVVGIASTFNIYDLVFDAVNAGVSATDANINIIDDVWRDSTETEIAGVIYNDGTVTVNAVPVPAAVWLFGSGLIGLVGIARRKTQLA